LHIGIFFSLPYWEFYIAKPEIYIAKPAIYIAGFAIYIPKFAIENFTEEKGNAMRGCRKGIECLSVHHQAFFLIILYKVEMLNLC